MLAEIYKVQYGQSIYDLGANLYGDASFAIKLVTDNGLDFSVYPTPGTNLTYYPELRKITPNSINTTAVDQSEFIYITGLSGQSIYDICSMGYGTFELLNVLLTDNNIESFDNLDANGITFKIRRNKINSSRISIYLQKKKPATLINLPIDTTPYFLLLEDGFYLLQENGFKIQL
jgi:hypothetical protein